MPDIIALCYDCSKLVCNFGWLFSHRKTEGGMMIMIHARGITKFCQLMAGSSNKQQSCIVYVVCLGPVAIAYGYLRKFMATLGDEQ